MLHIWIDGTQREIFGYLIHVLYHVDSETFSHPYSIFGYTAAPQTPLSEFHFVWK